MIAQIDPTAFDAWKARATREEALAQPGALPVVLDVREPWEVQTATIQADGFALMAVPMRELPGRLAELKENLGTDRPIACLCHHGMRSQQVAHFLEQSGFTEVVNIQGGIDAWSAQRDPAVPRY
jgi:rhodanese-related sulfurtransferase